MTTNLSIGTNKGFIRPHVNRCSDVILVYSVVTDTNQVFEVLCGRVKSKENELSCAVGLRTTKLVQLAILHDIVLREMQLDHGLIVSVCVRKSECETS